MFEKVPEATTLSLDTFGSGLRLEWSREIRILPERLCLNLGRGNKVKCLG